jgi:mannose-6-phosphate isomerase-like protein (cupin superfamily)
MARIIRAGNAKDLKLPGRKSLEIVSAQTGSENITLRLVEIHVPQAGEPPRAMHRHGGFEECMYVLAGEGVIHTEGSECPFSAGDTIFVPAGELHVTRNTGSTPLKLLCFFPTANCSEQK